MTKINVCLVLEGSYPYITGGVSSWVHQLIAALPDIDFSLFTISPQKDQPLRYELLPNVTEHKDIDLNARNRSKSRPRSQKELFKEIRRIHEKFSLNSVPGIEKILSNMPYDYFLYTDVLKNKIGWQMLTTGNRDHNPVYPFSDYFWTWKSAQEKYWACWDRTARARARRSRFSWACSTRRRALGFDWP